MQYNKLICNCQIRELELLTQDWSDLFTLDLSRQSACESRPGPSLRMHYCWVGCCQAARQTLQDASFQINRQVITDPSLLRPSCCLVINICFFIVGQR